MPRIATIKDEDLIRSKKGLYILGKDIREIPCFRSSILLGITCGTFAGLISFMATSKAALSSHIGFASLWVVVFGYWIPCRYNHETNKSVTLQNFEKALAAREAEINDTPLVKPEEEEKEQTAVN